MFHCYCVPKIKLKRYSFNVCIQLRHVFISQWSRKALFHELKPFLSSLRTFDDILKFIFYQETRFYVYYVMQVLLLKNTV